MDRERPFRVRQRAVVRSTGSGNSYKPAHLIGLGEVALRCWPGFAERLDRAGQIGDDTFLFATLYSVNAIVQMLDH